MFDSLFIIVFCIVLLYCFFTVLYLFVFSIAGKLYQSKQRSSLSHPPFYKRIAVLVPAYKEDYIILSTAQNLLQLDYPKELFDIYIIADSFRTQTVFQLQSLPLNLFEVSFDKSTKTKALNEAFSRIQKQYDIALICDADNMLPKEFLQHINKSFIDGARAVQGRRVAKNLDSSYAILDACSEAINNHIFRKGASALGLSSSIIGSGMAYEYNLIKNALSEIQAVGGFDKVLQLKVVQLGIRIEYLEQALVFDEKVDSPQAFKQQRKRWVSSQFIYLKQFFWPAWQQLLKGNFSYFNLALLNNLIVPRAFLLMLLPTLVLVSFYFNLYWVIATALLFVLYMVSLIIALPVELINKDLVQAVLRLPKTLWMMLSTILQINKSNKRFIHTVHTKTEVSNVLFQDRT